MPDIVDVAIVGAGPYGLSLASHLQAKGVRYRIFGKLMDAWRSGMPAGMMLKSHAWSSSLSDPLGEFTLPAFCAQAGIALGDADTPTLELFAAYGEAFQKRFVPTLEARWLTRLISQGRIFRLEFDDGEVAWAKRVVLAIGIHHFKRVPEVLSGLPPQALSHSADHGPIDGFAGKSVAIIGAGASATGLAALLAEEGAAVSLIARAPSLRFSEKPRARKSLFRRALSLLKPILRPGSGIGAGWLLKFCSDAPWAFHLLPQVLRAHLVRSQLGPLGHSAMKERVIGKIPLHLGCELTSASFADGKVELHLKAARQNEIVRVDHVIAATGYAVNLHRLSFLKETLLHRIATAEGAPILSMNYESSIAGLHFVGFASAHSFGPVMRFVHGASHPSRRLAAVLAKNEIRRSERAATKSTAQQFAG